MHTPTYDEYITACERDVTLQRLPRTPESRSEMYRQRLIRRVHVLRKLKHEFDMRPESVLECGTAGSLATPIAYSGTLCIALDSNLGAFGNETNYFGDLPPGKCGVWSRKNKDDIDVRLPRYKRLLADAESIPLNNSSIDAVVVFNDPFLFKKLAGEATRVLRPGGYLLGIIPNLKQAHNKSFYDSQRHTTLTLQGEFTRTEELPGLMAMALPPWLRAYESSPFTDIDGETWYAGDIFEVFRKPKSGKRE